MGAVPEIQRQDFIVALGGSIETARNKSSHLGLLLIDLTNLSKINHSHGYATGDLMLAEIYNHLLGIIDNPDTVFRVGCHRFALILPRLSSPSFIALALNKVTSLLKGDLFTDAGMVSAKLKIGVALNRNGARDTMAMLALAESSIAHVKVGGSHQLEDLVTQDQDATLDDNLEHLFAEALRDNDFDLHFQPKVNLKTGKVESAEALLRWTTQNDRGVSPETVVGLAESMGRSFELTKWVVHKSMRQLSKWQGIVDVGLAVNVQAGLVGDPDLPALLQDAISIWNVDPGKVTVEITEDAIIEDKEAGFNNLLKIKEQGINLSIDDFGTGYSSLSYFKHIPASELKIDKSFVSAMSSTPEDLELVKIIIHIAHQFGLVVVAEGVEDAACLALLQSLGCDYAQGYHFARALPAEDFQSWLESWAGFADLG